ncbi:hypothetical protein ABEB36_004466 [Hypothenemus hampei]|uniref:HAT C-terminal dimerisation domain-containing protein n=1 Tax=Hypothenemus hampei TaxID=57062 RepID=A0ABD1F423_HYPHA
MGCKNSPIESEPKDNFLDFGVDLETEIDGGSTSGTNLKNQADWIMAQYFRDVQTDCDMLQQYPAIYQIFRKFNTPVPSSAQVERLFSYATMTNMPKSNRLNDEKFEKRIILRANSSFNFDIKF